MFGFPFDAGIPVKLGILALVNVLLSIVEIKRRPSTGYLPFKPHILSPGCCYSRISTSMLTASRSGFIPRTEINLLFLHGIF